MSSASWGKAGVRLTAAEVETRRAAIAARANRQRTRDAENMVKARAGWARGLVRPWYITHALDLRALDGPEVDLACGVEEPTVDLWEAGEIYPTFEQLCALARLTEMLPVWFVIEHEFIDARIFICDRSKRTASVPYDPPDPITRFTTAALAAHGILHGPAVVTPARFLGGPPRGEQEK